MTDEVVRIAARGDGVTATGRHESIVARLRVHQFSIGDLMVVTTLIAVLLGGGLVCFRVEMVPLEVWQVLGGCWVASFILGAAVPIPAVLLLSRYPLRAFGALIVIAVGIHTLAAWLILAFPRAFGGTQTSFHTGPTLGVAAGVFLGFLLTLCLPLWAVRQFGYRLAMRGRASNTTVG